MLNSIHGGLYYPCMIFAFRLEATFSGNVTATGLQSLEVDTLSVARDPVERRGVSDLGHDHPEGEDRLESPMFELQERLVAEVIGTA